MAITERWARFFFSLSLSLSLSLSHPPAFVCRWSRMTDWGNSINKWRSVCADSRSPPWGAWATMRCCSSGVGIISWRRVFDDDWGPDEGGLADFPQGSKYRFGGWPCELLCVGGWVSLMAFTVRRGLQGDIGKLDSRSSELSTSVFLYYGGPAIVSRQRESR